MTAALTSDEEVKKTLEKRQTLPQTVLGKLRYTQRRRNRPVSVTLTEMFKDLNVRQHWNSWKKTGRTLKTFQQDSTYPGIKTSETSSN